MTHASLSFGIAGCGVLGPGLVDWPGAQPLLLAPQRWQHAATVVPAPALLPATERRRAGTVVKASVVVADAACAAAGLDPGALVTVFTSSTGDGANCHAMCEALATPQRLISPTRFTNSVHNVAAGYWHIATHSMQASTSLAAFDASFLAGLLEAAAQCAHLHAPVLLVACDAPYPAPLDAVRPVPDTFAAALVLVPEGGRRVRMTLGEGAPAVADASAARGSVGGAADATAPTPPASLAALEQAIPGARALPLLAALAAPEAARVALTAPHHVTLHLALEAR